MPLSHIDPLYRVVVFYFEHQGRSGEEAYRWDADNRTKLETPRPSWLKGQLKLPLCYRFLRKESPATPYLMWYTYTLR